MTYIYNEIIPGVGCKVSYAEEGGSFTEVGQLQDVGGTNSEVTMFDSTGIGSTAGEQVPIMFKAGDFSFNVFFNPNNSTHLALHGYHVAKTLLNWKFEFSNPVAPGVEEPESASAYTFAGYIKTFATSGFDNSNGAIAAITVAPTGEVDLG